MHVAQLLAPSIQRVLPGESLATIDSQVFDATDCWSPRILHVAGNIFAVAYQNLADNLIVVTYEIDTVGNITITVVDTATIVAITTQQLDFINISGNTFAAVYAGAGYDGFIKTFTIADDGTIGAVVDTYEYDTSSGDSPAIIHVSGNVFAIFYDSGKLVTVTIATDGTITAAIIASATIDTADPNFLRPKIINVSGTTFALTYEDSSGDCWVKTITINNDGTLSAVLDTLEFEPAEGYETSIINISGTLYAVVYGGPGQDGWVQTFTIAADGTIGAVIATFEFDYTYGRNPVVKLIADDSYAIFYYGNSAGRIAVVLIYSDGTISGFKWRASAVEDSSFTFYSYGGSPSVLEIVSGIFAIAHKGPTGGHSGYITTVSINT